MNSTKDALRYVGTKKLDKIIIVQCGYDSIESNNLVPGGKVLSDDGQNELKSLMEHAGTLLKLEPGQDIKIVVAPGVVNRTVSWIVWEYLRGKKHQLTMGTDTNFILENTQLNPPFRTVLRTIKRCMPITNVLVLVADHHFWLDVLTQSDMFPAGSIEELVVNGAVIVCTDIDMVNNNIALSDLQTIRLPD